MPALEVPFAVSSSSRDEMAGIQPDAPDCPRWQVWRRHRFILPSFLASLLVCAWFVTWGDWKFSEPEEFCGFYDAEARSIIEGRLDVPPAAIGSEAFGFQGKTYGYFGIGPALLRIPLVIAFKNMDGRWSRLMMMIACTINLICAYRIMRMVLGDRAGNLRTHRVLESLFILCAGIGSTNVFLVARSFTFHEAVMWGSAFALLFTLALLKYLARPRCKFLLLAGFFAFMSLHSRATAGVGALLALSVLTGVLTWRAFRRSEAGSSTLALGVIARPFTHAMVASTAVIIILGSYLGVNYAKFRTFDGVPLKYYDFYVRNPHYLQMTGGRQLHLENIPTTLATYFGMHGLRLDPRFPWLFPSREATFIGSPVLMVVEGFSTFPISMPALLTLALLGCLPLVCGSSETARRLRLPTAALFVGGGIMLATVAITERYLHDFYPAVIICAAVGIGRIEQEKHARATTIVITALSVISIAINCSLALENQRLDAWSVGGVPPAKRAEFKQLQKSIYRFFHPPTVGDAKN
jgi:hypothetical protein